uniref:Uncharacterized protein n=1 Tax=Panagrolaimus sp. PS1159 TaxID=55785 RepID=A0AC35F3E5_9BILA
MDFSKSYLTPREYWNLIMESITQRANVVDAKVWKTYCLKIAKRALFHLCYNREWNALKYKVQDDDGTSVYYFNAYGDTYLKLLNFQNDFYFESAKHKPDFPPYIVTKYDLEYPHIRLPECMQEYEKKSSRIPSAKLTTRYQKMKPLYHKIKAVEETVTEWFNLLLEVDDYGFPGLSMDKLFTFPNDIKKVKS